MMVAVTFAMLLLSRLIARLEKLSVWPSEGRLSLPIAALTEARSKAPLKSSLVAERKEEEV